MKVRFNDDTRRFQINQADSWEALKQRVRLYNASCFTIIHGACYITVDNNVQYCQYSSEIY